MTDSSLDGLRAKVRLLLSQVISASPIYKFRDPQIAYLETLEASTLRRSDEPPRIFTNPDDLEMTHEQVILLRTLYAQQPLKLQTTFPRVLLDQISEHNARVIVHTLLEITDCPRLLKLLENTELAKLRPLSVRRNVWQAIHEKLLKEPHRFTNEDLTRLTEALKGEIKRASRIKPPPPEDTVVFRRGA